MADLRDELGRYGIWSAELRSEDPALRGEIGEAAAELEALGFGAVWLGGSSGVEHAVPLAEATAKLTVATGILSIWQYEAADTAARFRDLESRHPGRFVLGLGASHARLAARYRRPYSAMVGYLDALAADGVPAGRIVLAALGPRMLELARDRAAGAHPYLVTPEHTSQARGVLGAGPVLAPELKVVLTSDAESARTAAREHFARYLALPNYTNSFQRLGFTEEDFAGGGSDRLVDAVYAWGDDARVRSPGSRPASASAAPATASAHLRSRTAVPTPPRWEASTVLARSASAGLACGPSSKSSSPAPAIPPARSAAASAHRSAIPALAVLTRIAERFIRRSAAASRRWRVSWVSGQCSDTTSLRSSSSGSAANSVPCSSPVSGVRGGVATTSMPRSAARRATARPTRP
nr:TIGR03620 family F420-dependent LLM class oxidoreductase [Marinitenerispora sediminis]